MNNKEIYFCWFDKKGNLNIANINDINEKFIGMEIMEICVREECVEVWLK